MGGARLEKALITTVLIFALGAGEYDVSKKLGKFSLSAVLESRLVKFHEQLRQFSGMS